MHVFAAIAGRAALARYTLRVPDDRGLRELRSLTPVYNLSPLQGFMRWLLRSLLRAPTGLFRAHAVRAYEGIYAPPKIADINHHKTL